MESILSFIQPALPYLAGAVVALVGYRFPVLGGLLSRVLDSVGLPAHAVTQPHSDATVGAVAGLFAKVKDGTASEAEASAAQAIKNASRAY